MRPGEFEHLLGECRHGAAMFASAVRKKIIYKSFGTTDRERCTREHKAFCGCWVYLPTGAKLELWLCEADGEVFASDDINKAKPFPRSSTKEIRTEVEAFCDDVAKDFERKVLT